METIEITEEQANVLKYLQNIKRLHPEYYHKVLLFGNNPNNIIKLIEQPEACGNWPFTYVCEVFETIKKLNKIYLKPFPLLKKPDVIEKFICKMLVRTGTNVFGRSDFFIEPVNLEHIIKFLQRDQDIYTWNTDFVLEVRQEYIRAKQYLDGERTELSKLFDLYNDNHRV